MTAQDTISAVKEEMARILVGQDNVVDAMLIGLLTGGHILLEGRPGLAKTLAVRTLAECLECSFSRIQFTPDLLPSDIVGSTVYQQEERKFTVEQGPISANLVLADEVNRAPAKVQSAVLEAMQERQVTIGKERFKLPEPFMVVATENPVEQAGTYPLPEAQKDRFLLQVVLEYPERSEEREVLRRFGRNECDLHGRPVATQGDILSARRELDRVRVDAEVVEYILDIVVATRPGQRGNLSLRQAQARLEAEELLECGASPRGSLALLLASKAYAMIAGRDYVRPDDVQFIAPMALSHRVMTSFDAESRGLKPVDVLRRIISEINAL